MAKSFNPSKYTQAVQGGATVLTHSSATTSFWGATTVTSPTVVISTTVVKSNSLIFLSFTQPVVGATHTYMVSSISPGGYFTVVGSWTVATSGVVFWEIKNQR